MGFGGLGSKSKDPDPRLHEVLCHVLNAVGEILGLSENKEEMKVNGGK